jgi:hypothetical protein
MTVKDFDDRALRDDLEVEAPPPAPALMEAVHGMKPVRPRSRYGAFLTVLLVGSIGPAALLLFRPMRRDLGGLPEAWVILGAAFWLGSLLLTLAAALIPRRGDVMPAAGRASRVGAAAMVVLFLFALLATVDVPGVSVRPADLGWSLFQSCAHCLRIVFPVAAVFLLLGAFVLRRALPMGARRIGIALGAAGGAMAGLALHFQCPIADTAHVVLAHVGGMILAAVAGALVRARRAPRGSRRAPCAAPRPEQF